MFRKLHREITLGLPCVLAAAIMLPLTGAAETLTVESAEYASPRDFGQKIVQQKVVLKGDLVLPASAASRMSAVVLLHSASGIQPVERDMASRLAKEGYAVFVPNRYGREKPGNADMPQNATADALYSLKALAADGRIDPARIAVAGVSAGGLGTTMSNADSLRASVIDDGVKFAAHIGFYPNCFFTSVGPTASTGAPMLILVGDKDTNASFNQCRDLVELHKVTETNSRITLKVFEGARHGFLDGSPGHYDGTKFDMSRCPILSQSSSGLQAFRNGKLEPPVPNLPAAYGDCRKQGVSMGGDSTAARDALNLAVAFLAEHMGGPPR